MTRRRSPTSWNLPAPTTASFNSPTRPSARSKFRSLSARGSLRKETRSFARFSTASGRDRKDNGDDGPADAIETEPAVARNPQLEDTVNLSRFGTGPKGTFGASPFSFLTKRHVLQVSNLDAGSSYKHGTSIAMIVSASASFDAS